MTEIQNFCNIENMQTQILEEIIKVRPRGVLTVPKKMREGLFDLGGVVRIKKLGRRLIIEPVKTLSYPVRSYSDKELQEFFDLDEKETKELKAKGLI